MSTKHTPGPWVARPDPSNEITGRDDWCIGAWGIAVPDAVAVCSECDAHLIAAAPDLLEALKQIEPILTRMYGPQAAELPPMQVVRAAIAKAEAA